MWAQKPPPCSAKPTFLGAPPGGLPLCTLPGWVRAATRIPVAFAFLGPEDPQGTHVRSRKRDARYQDPLSVSFSLCCFLPYFPFSSFLFLPSLYFQCFSCYFCLFIFCLTACPFACLSLYLPAFSSTFIPWSPEFRYRGLATQTHWFLQFETGNYTLKMQ